jgi:hypothetical protein
VFQPFFGLKNCPSVRPTNIDIKRPFAFDRKIRLPESATFPEEVKLAKKESASQSFQ